MSQTKKCFKVTVISPDGIDTRFIEGYKFTMGRSEITDLFINHSAISREHLTVAGRDGDIFVQDISTFGTTIGGQIIPKGQMTRYKQGAPIKLGQAPVIVSIRQITRLETSQLYAQQDKAFVARLVKQEAVQDINAWLSSKLKPHEKESSTDKKSLLRWEKDIEEQIKSVLNEVQSLSELAFQNAKVDALELIQNSRKVGVDIQNQSKLDAEAFLNDINTRGVQLIESSKQLSDQMKRETEIEIQTQKTNFDDQIKRMLAEADEQRAAIHREVDQLKNSYKTQAENQAADIVAKAQQDSADIIHQAKTNAAEQLQKAQHEGNEIILNQKLLAEKASSEVIEAAKSAAHKITQDAMSLGNENLCKASEEAKHKLDAVEAERAQLLELAQLSGEKIKKEYQTQGAMILKEAHEESSTSISDAKAKAQNMIDEAAAKADVLNLDSQKKLEQAQKSLSESKLAQEEQFNKIEEKRKLAIKELKDFEDGLQKKQDELLELTQQMVKDAKEKAENQLLQAKKQAEQNLAHARAQVQAEIDAKMHKAEERIKDYDGQILNRKSDLLALETQLKNQNSEKAKFEEQKHGLQKNIEKLENELQQTSRERKNEIEILVKQINENLENIKHQRQELDGFTKRSEAKKQEFSEQLTNIEKQTKSAKEQLGQLSTQNKDLVAAVAQLQSEQDDLKSVNGDLRQAIAKEKKSIIEEAQLQASQIFQNAKTKADELAKFTDSTLKEKYMSLEQELAARKLQANSELKAWQAQQEKANFQKRKEEIEQIFYEFDHGVIPLLEQIPNLGKDNQNLLSGQMRKIIKAVLSGESLEHQQKIKNLLSYRPEDSLSIRKYWYKMAWVGAAVVLILISMMVFPGFYSGLSMQFSRSIASIDKSQESVTRNFIEKSRQEREFHPIITEDFKDSYTDNLIYTKDYLYSLENKEYSEKWTLSLNTFFLKELELNETTTAEFRGAESALIAVLNQLKEKIDSRYEKDDIAAMKFEETQRLSALKDKIGGEKNFVRYWKFQKDYFEKHKLNAESSKQLTDLVDEITDDAPKK